MLAGTVWCHRALHGDARHCMVLAGTARCHGALHGDARHCTVLVGIARCPRALHGTTGQPAVGARHCSVLSNLPAVAWTRNGQCPVHPGRPPVPVPVPMPAARSSPAAGSAGFAVSGALFSAREALAQQMAGITKQLAAAKPIIYLIMIYHLTT